MNDSAFPIPMDDRPGAYPAEPGMSLRDYFAAQAMGNMFARNRARSLIQSYEEIAAEAYKFADTMLLERAK